MTAGARSPAGSRRGDRATRALGAADQRDGLPRRRGDPRRRPRCAPFSTSTPGSARSGRQLGLHDSFAGHDRYVTIGERIGSRRLRVPTVGIDWVTTQAAGGALRMAGPGRTRQRLHERGKLARGIRAARVRGADVRVAGARVPPLLRAARARPGRVRGRARHPRSRDRGPGRNSRRMAGSWPTRARSRATPGATGNTCSARRPS